ncbi:unnamed protein product, partial [Vitis vinifera]
MRKRSSTSVFLPKKKPIFKLLKKKLIFRSPKPPQQTKGSHFSEQGMKDVRKAHL